MKRAAILFVFISCAAFGQAPAPDCGQTQKDLAAAQDRLQDWPQLNRYAEANAKLPPPAKGEPRVVFLGDSITDGWNIADYFPGKPYVNRGISGQTTPQMLVRMEPDVIALRPRAVVILAGTNDIAGNTGPMTLEMIENNYRAIAELARANAIRVIYSSVLPVHDAAKLDWLKGGKMSDTRPPEKILALNKFLKDYCAKNGCVYLDYFSHMVDRTGMLRIDLANDGLHPNAAGYKLMAPLAEAAIEQALK